MRRTFTLLLATIIITSIQSQTADLSLNLEKGKEYKQTSNSNSRVLMNVMGQEMNISRTVNVITSFLVKDINKDGYIMEAKYEKLSMFMKMLQGGEVEISSEEVDANNLLIASLLEKIKGMSFEITMSKTGKITEVKNCEAIMETFVEGFDQLPEEKREEMKDQIKDAYGDEAIKSSMEMITGIFTDKPVKKGDKWKLNTSIESGMSMNLASEYELVELTSDYALIKGNATVVTPDKEANAITSIMPMQFDVAGTSLSEIKVDVKTGWIISAKITQDIQGEASMLESPLTKDQMPEDVSEEMLGEMFRDMKISMKMTTETVITN